MKRTFVFVVLFAMLGLQLAFAQTKQITGTVTSADDGLGIPGVSVIIKGTTVGTTTDIDGKYSLSVPGSDAIIVYSFVGLKTVEMPANQSVINVVMQSDSQELDEVVVTAYGVTKKSSLVGASTAMKAEQLESRPVTNVSNALGGIAPGVQITTSTGQPGASASVRIRGFGSINASSAPLYVVDGAIFDGSLGDIATADIQSVTVLKDAASTALYGSSAGNGVILITTKSGSSAKVKNKPFFTFSTSQGVSAKGTSDYEKVGVWDHYTLRWQQWFNQYHYGDGDSKDVAGAWAAYAVYNDLKYNPYAGIVSGYGYDGASGSLYLTKDASKIIVPAIVMPDGTLSKEITGLKYGNDLDWEDALFRKGYRQEYNVSGGLNGDRFRSFMSAGYLHEDGYRIATSYQRFNTRANVSYDVTKWFTTGANVSISRTHNEAPKKASGSYSSNSFDFIRGIAPIYPIHVHNEDGSFYRNEAGEKVYDHSSTRPYNGRFNPVEEAKLDLSTFDRDAITNRVFAEFKLLKGLKFTTNASYDLSRAITKIRYNNLMGDQPEGMLKMDDYRSTSLTFNQLLQYNTTLNDVHHIEALLGHENYLYDYVSTSMDKKGMAILGLDEMPNLANPISMSSGTTTYRKEGYFGRLNYDYSSKYYLSFSYRKDGSSKFASAQRWGNFWSAGASWRVSREEFMKDYTWLDELKLRLSAGQTGNDNLLDSDGYSVYYPYMTLFSLGYNNGDYSAIRFSQLGNPDLRWETQTSYDLALEFAVLKRVQATVEVFNKESKDLIFPYPLPTSSGVSSIDKNIGKVRNYGVEVDINVNIINNSDFSWDFGWNGTVLKNEIVSLPAANRKDGIELTTKKYLEGKSIYDFYLNEWIGVDEKDGMAMYRVDKDKYPTAPVVGASGDSLTWTKDGRFARKHFAGSSIPKLYGGFNTNFKWKGVDLSMVFTYQLGGKTYDGAYASLMGRSLQSGQAMHVDMKNAWREPGQKTNVPRLDAGAAGLYDALRSDRFLISSDALMLKSITVGYTLPKEWYSKMDVGSIRLGISGENLWLLSRRKGLNPMMNYGGVTESAIYDYARTFTGSLTMTF